MNFIIQPVNNHNMAKIKHNNFIDTVDEVFSEAKKEGVLHLYAEGSTFNGRTIEIKGRDRFHFGTTGYLGLEQDVRLKQAAIEAISNYGTQFPLSKSYISHPLYRLLEEKVEQMYGLAPIIAKNSTLGHLGVIPSLVRDDDGVILDHQVHWSVQNACQLLKLRGIPVEMIRHNNLTMLEDKIKEMRNSCHKVWYMADGVYSMYGDFAPIEDLLQLAQKYPCLHLYFDDVHGMSWKGKNGTGYVMDTLGDLPDNVVIMATLSKTFGASGAIFLCSDPVLREKIRIFGGPLTFSAQLEPASVGAAIASATIHLSPEIRELQNDLRQKIEFMNQKIEEYRLPLICKNESPVFFLGTAAPITGFHLVNAMLDEGFYLNLGIYPAVPIKNTGLRITISRHNRLDDIAALTEALAYTYPKALEATQMSLFKIGRSFGKPEFQQEEMQASTAQAPFSLEIHTSIREIHPDHWNKYMSGKNMIDAQGMEFLEQSFQNASEPEHQTDFYYITIKDKSLNVVVMTFFTFGLWKEDLLATDSISLKFEEKRKDDPYYMTAKVLAMGSLFTEGDHCYLDSQHPQAEQAFQLMLDTAEKLYHDKGAQMLVLRDFEIDHPCHKIILDHGFFKIEMPESCISYLNPWHTLEEFKNQLSGRSRKHFKKEVEPFEKEFIVEITSNLNETDLQKAYSLYQNVKQKNLAVNTFLMPFRVFEEMNRHPHWEFILLKLKNNPSKPLVGIMFCYKNAGNNYVPEWIGMDYDLGTEFGIYRQLLFQTIKRAKALQCYRIDFGITASFEKKKLGATIIPKVAYVQAKDNYSLELMGMIQNENKK